MITYKSTKFSNKRVLKKMKKMIKRKKDNEDLDIFHFFVFLLLIFLYNMDLSINIKSSLLVTYNNIRLENAT